MLLILQSSRNGPHFDGSRCPVHAMCPSCSWIARKALMGAIGEPFLSEPPPPTDPSTKQGMGSASPSLAQLCQRLQQHPSFRWVSGMRAKIANTQHPTFARSFGEQQGVVENPPGTQMEGGCLSIEDQIDLTDEGTAGVLIGMFADLVPEYIIERVVAGSEKRRTWLGGIRIDFRWQGQSYCADGDYLGEAAAHALLGIWNKS